MIFLIKKTYLISPGWTGVQKIPLKHAPVSPLGMKAVIPVLGTGWWASRLWPQEWQRLKEQDLQVLASARDYFGKSGRFGLAGANKPDGSF